MLVGKDEVSLLSQGIHLQADECALKALPPNPMRRIDGIAVYMRMACAGLD